MHVNSFDGYVMEDGIKNVFLLLINRKAHSSKELVQQHMKYRTDRHTVNQTFNGSNILRLFDSFTQSGDYNRSMLLYIWSQLLTSVDTPQVLYGVVFKCVYDMKLDYRIALHSELL